MEESPTGSATPSPTSSKTPLDEPYAVFASLWAVASLLSVWRLATEGRLTTTWMLPLDGFIALLAIIVLFRPRTCLPLVILAGLHLLSGLTAMPRLTATELLWTLCSATVAASYVTGCLLQRSLHVSPLGLLRNFSPSLRLLLVSWLICTCVAHCNWGFLRLESSSVVVALDAFRGETGTPTWVALVTMSIVFVGEACVAFALLLPRFRHFGIGLGSAYFAWQALLGLGEARSLAPLLLTLLYLFTSAETTQRISGLAARWIPLPIVRRWGWAIFSSAVALAAVSAVVWQPTGAGFAWGPRLVAAYQAAFVVVWLAVLYAALVDPNETGEGRATLLPRNPAHYLIVPLLWVAALSPFLGLGTFLGRPTDAGLAHCGARNNHVFLPQHDLLDYQSDVVEVLASSDAWLSERAASEELLTWFEFVNYVARRPETAVRFVRNGEDFAVERAGDFTELSQQYPWMLRKLLGFRPVHRAAVFSSEGRSRSTQLADRGLALEGADPR